MKIFNILKSLNWDDIFENTSQTENLYYFLNGSINKSEFVAGFYPKSKNKKLVNKLVKKDILTFKKHAKKLWNMSNVQNFSDGNESYNRKEYLSKLL